jgi:hypothetical protein
MGHMGLSLMGLNTYSNKYFCMYRKFDVTENLFA